MKLYSDAALAKILDKDIFHQISDVADRLGVECYVVGGYVRDIFLERPSDDIDVVVVGSGIEVAKELKKSLGRKAHLSVFKNFGTASFKVSSEQCSVCNEATQDRDSQLNTKHLPLNTYMQGWTDNYIRLCRPYDPALINTVTEEEIRPENILRE